MTQIATIGRDIAKNVFQVHAVGSDGEIILKKRLYRSKLVEFFERLDPCLIGIEACATAHHWARVFLQLGHTVKLMPPAYVRPYVKRSKNDAADAEAICEAASRPNMRFMPIREPEQQSALMLHQARDLLIRQQTMLINAIRSHFAEFGIIAAQGVQNVKKLVEMLDACASDVIPSLARTVIDSLIEQLVAVQTE